MRKIRNPRYAPEFLERKLSPSAVLFAPPEAPTAEYAQFISEPPPPPDIPPGDPLGPVGPA